MNSGRKTVLAFALGMLLLGAACDMSTPSQVNLRPIQIKDGIATQTLDAWHVDPSQINIIAQQYHASGKGPLSLTLSYQAQDKNRIRLQGMRYLQAFAHEKVTNIKISYVAMDDPAYAGQAIVSYPNLTAAAPAGCGHMPGYYGTEPLDEMKAYKVGCEMDQAVAQMVVDPADLMGNAGVPEDDSKRAAALTDKYRAGTPNVPLQGLNASSIGTNSGGGGSG